MNRLTDILYKVPLESTSGPTGIEVNDIQFDSRKVGKGSVFVAYRGVHADGHTFIEKAISQGAVAIVCEEIPDKTHDAATYIGVKDSQQALGVMAANYYDNPSNKIRLVAITGTNGKTSTATILHELFMRMGYHTGLISTVENKINDNVVPSTHTTPDPLQLNALLAEMVKQGCTHCFMEASSHAIHQKRIAGLLLTGAVFTNITHDHLDYHGSFDAYISAKKKLFDDLPSNAFALSNGDDKRGMVMLQNTRATKYYYALRSDADFRARVLSNSMEGLELDFTGRIVWFNLIGNFNAYNLLAAYSVAVLLGEPPEEVLTQLSLTAKVRGRFEYIVSSNKITAIIDYAHTPDALEKVLETIGELRTRNEQVITVIGCGGNRDAAKRPIMAKVASKLSDKVILTSDNPRDENPETILDEMQKGISPVDMRKMLRITDRKEALRTAIALAHPKDIILIAGKGHETYQEIKGKRLPFDDFAITRNLFETLGK